MPCPVSSNRQRKTKKNGRRWASATPSYKKNTKTKNNTNLPEGKPSLCWSCFFFSNEFGISRKHPKSQPWKTSWHFGTLWVAQVLGLPTPQMQHSTMVGHPTVRPLEIAAVSNLLCLLLLMCFFWWCDNRINKLWLPKKEHPEVSPKPCFSLINFCLNSECLELDVSQLTRPQRTFLTAGSGFRAEMIRYFYPNKTFFQWKVVWNFHYATVRSLLLAVSSPLVGIWAMFKCPSKEIQKLPSREDFWHPGIFCLASRDGVFFQWFWWMMACACPCPRPASTQLLLCGRWAWVSLSDLYLKWITACRDCLLLLYSMSQREFRVKSAQILIQQRRLILS